MVSNQECCGNCEFYMATVKVCRRYPPIPVMLGTKQGLGGTEPAVAAYFPNMLSNGWCGEHRMAPDMENNYATNS